MEQPRRVADVVDMGDADERRDSMEIAFGLAALLGGLATVVVVLTVYNGVRTIERQQRAVLERLDRIEERLGERR